MLAWHVERDVDDVLVQRSKVAVFDQAGNVHFRIVGVQPEVVRHCLAQLGDHTDHGDVSLRAEGFQCFSRQIGHQAWNVG
ncbi:hypothetical protein D3C78_1461250 [compost metagenome]